MKKISLVVIGLLISAHGFTSEDSVMLWAGFDTSMSAQDVLKKTQGLMGTDSVGREKIGLKITYGKKDEKVTSQGHLTAYCSMTAPEKMRFMETLATIRWCFDSIVTRNKIPTDNKLVFIQIRVAPVNLTVGELYLNIYNAADRKYEETSYSELLRPDKEVIHVPPSVDFADITNSRSGLFESEDVLIFLRSSYFTVAPFGFVHLDYVSKQAYLEADRQAIEALEAKAMTTSEDEL